MNKERTQIAERLRNERGTLYGHGRRSVALVYPSPYRVGMSSLGFQTIYRLLNGLPEVVAERAFLPDGPGDQAGLLTTYESGRPVGDFPLIAFSVAYELEIVGMLRCLELAGIPLERAKRAARDPLVIVGGPLTFSNPAPLGLFADLVVMGEADAVTASLVDALFADRRREDLLRGLAAMPGFWVPSLHGSEQPALLRAPGSCLPAYAAMVTPDTELGEMFLVEAERGCSRGCAFCVMRRSSKGGMRVVAPDKILGAVPPWAARVGLVGAAVSDHPRLAQIVGTLAAAGKQVSLSSVRADRLTSELLERLVASGCRSLTVAADGASERIREKVEKGIKEKDLLQAARLARAHGLAKLKLYAMVGLPEEEESDLEELVALARKQAQLCGAQTRMVLAMSPFVPKRNTPLVDAPFAGIKALERRLAYVRKRLEPTVEVRPASARWAWVEYLLAQGGVETGQAVLEAYCQGGGFASWRRACRRLPQLRRLL